MQIHQGVSPKVNVSSSVFLILWHFNLFTIAIMCHVNIEGLVYALTTMCIE